MSRLIARLLALALLAACSPDPVASDDPAPRSEAPLFERAFVIQDVVLFDGLSDTPLPGQSVLVVGDRIAAIGPRGTLELPSHAEIVPGEGHFLMPGLIDAHTHITHWGDDALVKLVDAGVTTARDMGGDLDAQLALRDATRRGDRLGPDLLLCGPFLEGSAAGGEHREHVDGPEQAAAAVRALVERGVDFLKVQPKIESEVVRAIVAQAAALDRVAVGHVPAGLSPQQAVELGLKSVEHVESFLSLDDAALDTTFAAFRAHDAWLTPALFGMQAALEARGADPDSDAQLARARQVVARAHAAGVPLLVGSNFAFRDWPQQPGSGLHGELRALVDAGLPAADVLRMATHGAACFLGREREFGSLRVGLRADMLLLHANPLEDIANSASLHYIVMRGFLFGPRAP
ncbi:MAG: peptidase M38 [Planctomycetota bacterium]|nr:MAG: peptidase M38 [Planctomycetota bacterium]